MTDEVSVTQGLSDALNRLRDNLASAPPGADKCFVSLDDHRAILAALRTTHSPSEGEVESAAIQAENHLRSVGWASDDLDYEALARAVIATLSLPSDKTVELLREALTDAAVTFEFYADEHQAKAQRMEPLGRITAERDERLRKSDRNRLMGVKMRKALALLLDGDSHLGEMK